MPWLSEQDTAMAYAVTELLGGKQPLNYFTHLNEELGFIYFSTPAVANIRTIGSLNLAMAGTMGVDFEYTQIKQIHNRQTNVIGNPNKEGYRVFDQMLDDPDVVKFTFLRDPVDRFAALYRNVFSTNTRRAYPRQRLFEHLGISIMENLSMLDLAEMLSEEEGLKALLPQLRNQRQMVAFDLVDYTFIGRHENWEKDFGRVANEIFGREIEFFDPMKVFNQDPEGIELQANVDGETRRALEEAYSDDYEMLEEVAALFPLGFSAEHQG